MNHENTISVKRIAKNFSSLLIAQGIYKIFAFVTFILIARSLGVEAFGQMSYALSFAAFFMIFADFGVSDLLVREVAGVIDEKGKVYINNIAILKLCLAVFAYGVMLLAAFITEAKREIFNAISVFGLAMILDSYTVFLKSIFRAFEKMKYEGFSVVLEGVLKVALVLWVIKAWGASLSIIAQLFLLVSVITLIFTFMVSRAKFTGIGWGADIKFWFHLIQNGFPIGLLICFQMVNFKIAVVMLSKMASNIAAGLFSVAMRLIEPVLIIPVTLTVALFPVVSRLGRAPSELLASAYDKVLRILLIFSVSITIFLFFAAKSLIPFLFGAEFEKSANGMRLLALVLIPTFWKIFLDSFVLALKRPAILAVNYLSGISAAILLNWLLIPRLNFYGACISCIAAECLMVMIYMVWFKRNFVGIPRRIR